MSGLVTSFTLHEFYIPWSVLYYNFLFFLLFSISACQQRRLCLNALMSVVLHKFKVPYVCLSVVSTISPIRMTIFKTKTTFKKCWCSNNLQTHCSHLWLVCGTDMLRCVSSVLLELLGLGLTCDVFLVLQFSIDTLKMLHQYRVPVKIAAHEDPQYCSLCYSYSLFYYHSWTNIYSLSLFSEKKHLNKKMLGNLRLRCLWLLPLRL